MLAIIGVGALVWLVTQPKKGSLEWHKREYEAAAQGSLTFRLKNLWWQIRGEDRRSRVISEERNEHQQALIHLGYLEQREFVISNRSIDEVINEVARLFRVRPTRWGLQDVFLDVDTRGTNIIIIVAARDDMPVVAKIIRKTDVP